MIMIIELLAHNKHDRCMGMMSADQPTNEHMYRQRELKKQKAIQKLKAQLKKRSKKSDKRIASLVVVFPLPCKDPLLAHRKLFDLSRAFDLVVDSSSSYDDDDLER